MSPDWWMYLYSSQRRDTVCGDHWHWCGHQTPDDSIATFLRIVTNFPHQNYYHFFLCPAPSEWSWYFDHKIKIEFHYDGGKQSGAGDIWGSGSYPECPDGMVSNIGDCVQCVLSRVLYSDSWKCCLCCVSTRLFIQLNTTTVGAAGCLKMQISRILVSKTTSKPSS